MKKITQLFILSILFINVTNAQFTVNKSDGTPFIDNEVIEFTTNSTSSAELKFVVNNNGPDNLDFRIRCMNLVNNTGNNFQLCWGFECIPSVALSGIYPNYQNVINSGGNTVGFGDSFKNFNPGDGVNYPLDFSFRFITKDVATGAIVGSNFNLTYRYQGPLSLDQKDKLNQMGVKVINTVVDNFIGLEIQKEVDYFITNLQGQVISNGLLSNNINLDLSSVQKGVYLLNFSNVNGLSDTIKIYKK